MKQKMLWKIWVWIKQVDYLSKADFVIYVVDASESLDKSDEQIIHLLQDKKECLI